MKPISEIIKDLGPEWEGVANEMYYPTSDEGKEYEAFLRGVHKVHELLIWI